jgi:hypothetical protein
LSAVRNVKCCVFGFDTTLKDEMERSGEGDFAGTQRGLITSQSRFRLLGFASTLTTLFSLTPSLARSSGNPPLLPPKSSTLAGASSCICGKSAGTSATSKLPVLRWCRRPRSWSKCRWPPITVDGQLLAWEEHARQDKRPSVIKPPHTTETR